MNRRIIRNFLLFLAIVSTILISVSCPTSPINKSVTVTFEYDEHVTGIVIKGSKSTGAIDKNYKHSVKVGEELSFDIATDPLYMVKSISGQVDYSGGKTYTTMPTEDTKIKIETVRRAYDDKSTMLVVKGDSGVETVTLNQVQDGKNVSTTRLVSNSSTMFEKESSSTTRAASDGTLIIRPKSGYRIENVTHADAVIDKDGEYIVKSNATDVVVTSVPDSTYVNDFRTVIINHNGGVGDTSVIFYKDGAYYSDNKGTSQIASITPPAYGDYIITLNVSEENVVIDKGEGEEGETIKSEIEVPNRFSKIVSPRGDALVNSESGEIRNVSPFDAVEEFNVVWETDEVNLPVLRQNGDNRDEYTKRFLGWGLKQNDPTVDLKATDGSLTISYTPKSTIPLYDKWINESYTLNVKIVGSENGVVLKGREGNEEYKNEDKLTLSKQVDLIFRLKPNEGYTYTYSLKDNNGNTIESDAFEPGDDGVRYSFKKEQINKYSELTLEVRFGVFPTTVLSGDVTLVKGIEINDTNFVTLPRLTLTIGTSTNDRWDESKLQNKVDITDKVYISTSKHPLTNYGETLKAYLTYDGSDGDRKRAIVSIEGTPTASFSSSDNIVIIDELPFSYLAGRTETDNLNITLEAKFEIKDSVAFTFSPISDDNNIKNRFNGIIIDKTDLVKERTLELSNGSVKFTAQKDADFTFTPLFEPGYALLDAANIASSFTVVPQNVVINSTDDKDKFVVYASTLRESTDVDVSVVSREKSITILSIKQNNVDVESLVYNVGDTRANSFTINLQNNGYEDNMTQVEPSIFVVDGENRVNIKESLVGGVTYTWDFRRTEERDTFNGFVLTLYPRGVLLESLSLTSLIIVMPSSAFVGETKDVEVLYKDNKPEIPFIIYPSVAVSGNITTAENIGIEEMKETKQIALTSESALNNDAIGDGADITEYITVGETEEPLSSFALTATLLVDKAEGEETSEEASDVKSGHIVLSGTASKALAESTLNFSLPAKLFKGFEEDEQVLKVKSTSNAKLKILETVNLTFIAASDTNKDKLSSITINDSATLKGTTLDISSAEGKKASKYVVRDETVSFTLAFEEGYALDNLNPFSPEELVKKVSSETEINAIYQISGDNLTEDKEIIVTSAAKNITLDSVKLESYSVGDGDGDKKVSEFSFVASGYTIIQNVSSIEPIVKVDVVNASGVTTNVSIGDNSVGGTGFSANLDNRNDEKAGFILRISPKRALTSSLTPTAISVSFPASLFTNADGEVKAIGLDDVKLVIYPQFKTKGNGNDVVMVKGISDEELLKSHAYTLESDTLWSDDKVGSDEQNAKDITSAVAVGEEELSSYGLSAHIYFEAGTTTKREAKVVIKGTPNKPLETGKVEFNLNSSFFKGFENTSYDGPKTLDAKLTIRDSVNLTFKASDAEGGITDQLEKIVISENTYIKQRELDMTADKTKTVAVDKNMVVEFEPTVRKGFALDNTEPFTLTGTDSGELVPIDGRITGTNNKYTMQSSVLNSDKTLTVKTIEMSVTMTEVKNIEFNVGDGTDVKVTIPLTVKGYVLSATLPTNPTLTISVGGVNISNTDPNTSVGGRGFNASITKDGSDLILTISPKAGLLKSLGKTDDIAITLPRTLFTNASEVVDVTGDNISASSFVIYPSYTVSSSVSLINGVNTEDLAISPQVVVKLADTQTDVKWKEQAEGLDITDKVKIGADKTTLISVYGLTAKFVNDTNDKKTAYVVIEGTPNQDTKSISEPITLNIDGSLLEGYEDLSGKEIKCSATTPVSFLVEKSVELKFKTPDLASDGNNEDARKLKSVSIRADGLKGKEYTLENGVVSVFVKVGKNITFKPTYETGYAAATTPFTPNVSDVRITTSGDDSYPYQVNLTSITNNEVIITGTSVKKDVYAVSPEDLKFSVSSSSASKTLSLKVDGYEFANTISDIKPLVYAIINNEEVDITDEQKLIGGVGFNVSMTKRNDEVSGINITISPNRSLTDSLEISKIKIVIPHNTFMNEKEDVVVSGLDDTYIVIIPSVSASGTATFVQNVSTDMLITEPVISLTSNAMWNISDDGYDIRDALSLATGPLDRSLFNSILLIRDETDITGRKAFIKFSGKPGSAISGLTTLRYNFDTSYFVGKFTKEDTAKEQISVSNNTSQIRIVPSQKVTFNVPSLNSDSSNEDARKLKSINVRPTTRVKVRTLVMGETKEVSEYFETGIALSAVLLFEDGYSLSSSSAYVANPNINISGLGTDGSPTTIASGVLSADTTITISSVKRGITLSEVSPSSEKGIEYTIGDTSSKAYTLTVKMVGYSKRSSISGSSNPRVMIRKTNGELVDITTASVGGVGFNVSSVSSPSDGFTITISPKGKLTSALPNGTIVIYLPSTYIEGATSEVEVVGGENLRSFNIYPSLNLSGTVNLVKGIDTKDLVATTTFKLVSDAPFSESYIASSRLVTPPSTSESSDDNKEVGESYMLSNSDISEYMSVGSDSFQSYGNSAKISIDSSDSSGKTAIITISGVSTKVLSSLSDVNISLPISYFSDYVQSDKPLIKATSTAKMDISDSVPLIFKKNTTSEDKGKLTKVTVSSTNRIKEVSHTFTSTEDTFETSVESNVATRFTLEYEKGYYIDTYAPFTLTPSVEINNVDDKLTTFEIAPSTLRSSTVIVVNTVKQQVIMDGVLEGYFEYFIGDSTDTKLVISSHVAGLIIKDNVAGIVPIVNLNVNGALTDITSTAIGGVGFNVSIEKRTDRDGFLITLSPKGPITESLVVSELTITLPKALFENGDADYNLDNLDSSMIFYPSATATGNVNLYYFEEIPEDTIVALTSETPWSTVVIGNELDITEFIRISSYDGKKLKDYGETLKAMLSIDPSDSFRKTALVKFSGVPQVLQKEPQKVLFDFTPNLFSGFEGEDFLLDPTSFVEFSVIESPNRSAVVNSEDVSDITYSVSSEASSVERVFRVAMNGYMLSDDISSITPLIYVVNGEKETLISEASIGGVGFNVSMVKNDEGNGVNITLSPKGALQKSLKLSKIKVLLPASTFKNQIEDVVVDGFENTNLVIYPAVTARGEIKFVQNISDTLLNVEPIITLTSTSPWNSSIPSSGKEIKDIISLEGDTNLLSLFGDDFKATLTKDEADIEGKTAHIKFSGTPTSALSDLAALNYDFDTSYFDGTFVATGSEPVDVSVIDNTSKLVIAPSHKVTIKASSENEKDRLNKIKVLKSENIKERDTIILPQSRTTSVYTEDSKALDVVLEFDTGYSLASDKPYTTTPEIVVVGLGTTGSPMSIASGVIKNDVEIVVSSVRKSIYLTKVAQGSTSSGSEAKGIEYSVNDDKTKAFTFVLSMDGYSKATNISGSPRVEIRKADGTKLDITDTSFGGVGFDVKTNTESSASGMTITISPKAPLTASLPAGAVVITIPQSFIKDADGDIEVVSGDEYRSFKILPSLTISGNASLVKGVADTSLLETQTFTLTSETPFVDKSIGISALVRVGERTLRDYGTGLKATYKLDASDKTNKTAIVTITGTPTVALTTSSTVSINQLPLTYFEGFETETNKINSTSSTAKMDISDSITLTVGKNSSDADKGKLTKVTIGKTSRIKGVAYTISPTSTGVVRKIVEKGVPQHFTFAYDNDYFIDDTAPFTASPSIAITKSEGKLYEYDIASDVLTADTSITVNTVKKGVVFDGTDDALKFKVGDDTEVKATVNTLLNGLVIKEDLTGIVPTITVDGKDITEALGGVGFNVALSKRKDDKNGFTLELSPKASLTESLVLSSYKVSLPSSLFENDERETVKNYDVENIASKLIIYPSITATGEVETIINREVESDTTIKFISETAFSEGNVRLNGDITTLVTIGEGDESKPLTDYGKGLSAKMTIDPTDTNNKTVIVTFRGTPQTLLTSTVMNFNLNASYFAGFESEKEPITTNSSVQFTVNEVPGDPIPLITVNGKDLTHSSMKDTTLTVTIPEEYNGKDLYLIISNPQYDSLPSPTLAGYEIPTKTTNNLLSEYMSPFAVDPDYEDEYCDTPRMEEEFQKSLEEEQYALMVEAMSNDYAISTQAANETVDTIWKNPFENLEVGKQVFLNDEVYLTPSTPAPKPGLYRTSKNGYEKVPASLQYKKKVEVGSGKNKVEKELLIVVEDDVWGDNVVFSDPEITEHFNTAYAKKIADQFLSDGKTDIYGNLINFYGDEWGVIPEADRVRDYYRSKRKDGTTYSDNGEYIGVTNQIVLFFARLDGATDLSGSNTLGYYNAAHLKCNSSKNNKSNQSVCLTINAFNALNDLNRCTSTCAHEFQHAIYNYQRKMSKGYDPKGQFINSLVNSTTEPWVNEMFSTLVQDTVSTILESGPASYNANGMAPAPAHAYGGRIPSYFTAQRYGLTDWRRIQNVYSPNNTAITYGLVYSFGSYIVRNYGKGLNDASGEFGFIKKYLASDENEFPSAADMPSESNGWSNSKSNALNMIIQAIRDSDPEYANVTWEDILQGWAAAILLSDKEEAKVPYKLVKNNGSDYWWNGVYDYGMKVPSINYFNYIGSSATLWEGGDKVRTTGPVIFNSNADRIYDMLPQGNQFYGNSNTYVLLGKGLSSGTHTYTVDGDTTYKYGLVLK